MHRPTRPASSRSVRSVRLDTVISQTGTGQAALDELAVALAADVAVVLDDDRAAAEARCRPCRRSPKPSQAEWSMFMWCLSLMPILVLRVRVPDDDVGVGAGGDDALLRVHAEHARRRGAAGLDPALERRSRRRPRPGRSAPCGARRRRCRWGSRRSRRGRAPSGPSSRTGSGRCDTTASSFMRRPFHRSPWWPWPIWPM